VQPWQLVGLLTASELINSLGVDSRSLPRGVKATSSQFAYYRDLMATSNLKAQKVKLRQWDARRKPIRYAHLRCIETGRSKGNKESKVMTVSLSTFYESVRVAMMDDSIQLIPLVSIISKKIPLRRGKKVKAEDFSVDYLLPVQVDSHWVGVVYREGECTMVLLDGYDIVNKALLCDPTFDIHSIDWFKNPYDRLRVLDDAQMADFKEKESSKTNSPVLSSSSPPSSPRSPTPTFSVNSNNSESSLSLSAYSTQSTGSTVFSWPTPSPNVQTEVTPQIPMQYPMANPMQIPMQMPVQCSMNVPMQIPSPSSLPMMQWTNDVLQSAMQDKAHFDLVFVYNAHFAKCRGQ